MTEKEKMLAGMIYDANNDAELERERARAKVLCHEFNSVSPAEPGHQREILRNLLGKTHDTFTILPSSTSCAPSSMPFWIQSRMNFWWLLLPTGPSLLVLS